MHPVDAKPRATQFFADGVCLVEIFHRVATAVLLPLGWSNFWIGKTVRRKNRTPARNKSASGFGKHILVVIEVFDHA